MRRFARGTSILLATLLSACSASPPPTPVPAPAPTPAPVLVAAAPPTVPSPPAPSAIPSAWDAHRQAAHVLERLAYGPRPGDVNAVTIAGVEAWIRRQLVPSTIDDATVDAKLRALPSLAMTPLELHAKYPRAMNAASQVATATPTATPTPTPSRPNEIERDLAAAKMLRAVESARQLQEVLVDFWFNHFNVYADKGQDRWLVGPYERDAIRPHVFGRFRDLLGAVAHHPAMLFYLDNWLSVADGAPGVGKNKGPGGINENYGRELLELHTLGVDGGYSQDDVRETARAFTGWSIERPGQEAAFAFRPRRHDDGAKTVLARALGPGGGERDGEAVLDLVASHPATARHLAQKLCAKFVADDPPAALVERVAGVFTQSGGDLTATYEAIVFSPEFWSEGAEGTKTKTPLEVAASAARAVGASVDAQNDLPKTVARMGEPLYRAAPPTGWKETADAWVSTGSLVARIDFGLALAAGRVKGVTFDREKLVGDAPPADPGELVDRLARAVLARPLSASSRDTIVNELGASRVTYQEAQPDQLPRALGLLLGSPEFQKQ